jgi:hypothetical protein
MRVGLREARERGAVDFEPARGCGIDVWCWCAACQKRALHEHARPVAGRQELGIEEQLEGVGAGAHHVVPKVARIEGAPIEKHTSAALAAIVDEGTANPGA